MGSIYPPGCYDEEKLEELESVFRDVCRIVAVNHAYRNPETDEGLRTAIAKELLNLVAAGVTSPEELRARALLEFGSKVTTN